MFTTSSFIRILSFRGKVRSITKHTTMDKILPFILYRMNLFYCKVDNFGSHNLLWHPSAGVVSGENGLFSLAAPSWCRICCIMTHCRCDHVGLLKRLLPWLHGGVTQMPGNSTHNSSVCFNSICTLSEMSSH